MSELCCERHDLMECKFSVLLFNLLTQMWIDVDVVFSVKTLKMSFSCAGFNEG